MKKMFVMIICIVVFATFAFAVEARSLQNQAITKTKLASSYNLGRDRSLARIDLNRDYREKMNAQRLQNIEKSNKQYAQKRESKVVQNKAVKMQKIGLFNANRPKITGMVGSSVFQQKAPVKTISAPSSNNKGCVGDACKAEFANKQV